MKLSIIIPLPIATCCVAIFGLTTFTVQAEEYPPKLPLLKYGSKGENVVALQAILKQEKYFNAGTAPHFGPKTKASVETLQKSKSPPQTIDGKVGPKTWAKLLNNKPYPRKQGNPFKKSSTGYTDVRRIQLKVGTKPDGKFGTKTGNAVVKWQKYHNAEKRTKYEQPLKEEPIVGKRTWTALFRGK